MITIARYNLKIYNLNTDKPPMGVAYVGRPTPFGNPYSIYAGKKKAKNVAEESIHLCKTRAEAVEKFKEYCKRNTGIEPMARKYLKGKDLSCWCVPDQCHAMVLMDMANAPEIKTQTIVIKDTKGKKR